MKYNATIVENYQNFLDYSCIKKYVGQLPVQIVFSSIYLTKIIPSLLYWLNALFYKGKSALSISK